MVAAPAVRSGTGRRTTGAMTGSASSSIHGIWTVPVTSLCRPSTKNTGSSPRCGTGTSANSVFSKPFRTSRSAASPLPPLGADTGPGPSAPCFHPQPLEGADHHGTPSHQCHRVSQRLALTAQPESKTNPRRTFEDAALKELAESIRVQGVLSPLAGAASH